MILDSRTFIVEQGVAVLLLYSASEASGDVGVWIQPPIGLQVIDSAESTVIDGVYVQTQPTEIVPLVEPDLAWELEAWEAASDEALMLFETECE